VPPGTLPDMAAPTEGKLDRELNELLQELRVILPGVQVLFAFLLAVPFAQGFADLTDGQRRVFFAAFVATAMASILLMAPGVQHRLRLRQRDKEELLRVPDRFAITGTGMLAIAISAVVCLIADVIYGKTTASIAAGVVALTIVLVWWVGPHVRAARD